MVGTSKYSVEEVVFAQNLLQSGLPLEEIERRRKMSFPHHQGVGKGGINYVKNTLLKDALYVLLLKLFSCKMSLNMKHWHRYHQQFNELEIAFIIGHRQACLSIDDIYRRFLQAFPEHAWIGNVSRTAALKVTVARHRDEEWCVSLKFQRTH